MFQYDRTVLRIYHLYKCVASTSMKPDKVYLKTIEGDFKQRLCSHKKYFNNSTYRNDTTISKYVWDVFLTGDNDK